MGISKQLNGDKLICETKDEFKWRKTTISQCFAKSKHDAIKHINATFVVYVCVAPKSWTRMRKIEVKTTNKDCLRPTI